MNETTVKAIYKYILVEEWRQVITMPTGAIIRKADVQSDDICIWAEVEPDAPTVQRTFWLYGTGHEFQWKETLAYVGTVFRGRFVWHIYEEVKTAVQSIDINAVTSGLGGAK